jgi:signal transduction histidine kinase
VPFSLFYSGISTVLVAAIARHSSVWLARIATMVVVFLPATLIHLAFTFPRQREVIREAPALATTPYLMSLFLVPPAWMALERDALLWPSVVYLLLALTAGAWLILLVSCGYAMRESKSALERARARVLCYGAVLLPIPPALLAIRAADGVAGATLVYLGAAALTMPLPIGLAISRYNLFNLEVDTRTWIARLIYAVAAASVVGATFAIASRWLEPLRSFSSPAVVFAVAFAGVVAIEPIRRRLVGVLDAVLSPDAERLRDLRKGFTRLVCELRDPDEIARLLQETLQVGLSSRGGCVFLRAAEGWRPASAFGEPAPTSLRLAEAAIDLLRSERLMDLGLREAGGSASEHLLRRSRVQLVALLERRGERSGLVLMTGSEIGLPYNRLDLDFVSNAIEQATIALYNARLAEDLIAAERQVTTGRIALALAHDVGKELDWLHRLVQRLPERLGDPGRASRDLRTIAKLTEDLVGTIRGFVQEAREPVDAPSDAVELDHVIEQAVRTIDRLHRATTVTRCVDPSVRKLPIDPAFERVLVNVLDNAARAGYGDDAIHLYATAEEGALRITVTDHGSGMTEEVRQNAFRMGFTTRSSQGGSGVGLAVSGEIVSALGGAISVVSNPETGTQVSIRIPLQRGPDVDP